MGNVNPLAYSAREQAMFTRLMQDLSGYKTLTTFYGDLSIAECFGQSAIKETYRDVLGAWGRDTKYFTEFVLALNHKSWEHNEKNNRELVELYADLYYKADAYVSENWTEEQKDYYYTITD